MKCETNVPFSGFKDDSECFSESLLLKELMPGKDGREGKDKGGRVLVKEIGVVGAVVGAEDGDSVTHRDS